MYSTWKLQPTEIEPRVEIRTYNIDGKSLFGQNLCLAKNFVVKMAKEHTYLLGRVASLEKCWQFLYPILYIKH
jgi:hypothetical protein